MYEIIVDTLQCQVNLKKKQEAYSIEDTKSAIRNMLQRGIIPHTTESIESILSRLKF